MAKQIKQFRYYGKNNINTYPMNEIFANGNKNNTNYLVKGNIFEKYNNITQLGIQAKSGTTFWLNDTGYEIIIGDTGIFEIDLQDLGTINKIRFSESDITDYDNLDGKDRLLIDIIYEGGSN